MRPKMRLDGLLVEGGFADSRQKAQALILAGQVLVDDQKVEKCGVAVSRDAPVRLLGEPPKYVSRGGLKLEGALAHFQIDVTGRVGLDVGASTGGVMDCLHQRKVSSVLAAGVSDTNRGCNIRH